MRTSYRRSPFQEGHKQSEFFNKLLDLVITLKAPNVTKWNVHDVYKPLPLKDGTVVKLSVNEMGELTILENS